MFPDEVIQIKLWKNFLQMATRNPSQTRKNLTLKFFFSLNLTCKNHLFGKWCVWATSDSAHTVPWHEVRIKSTTLPLTPSCPWNHVEKWKNWKYSPFCRKRGRLRFAKVIKMLQTVRHFRWNSDLNYYNMKILITFRNTSVEQYVDTRVVTPLIFPGAPIYVCLNASTTFCTVSSQRQI